MLTRLIATNKPKPDPRAGSVPALGGEFGRWNSQAYAHVSENTSAYAAACTKSVNVTIPATLLALTLPDSWDGPFVSVLPFPAAVVTAIFGGVLGIGAIVTLSNM